MTERIPYKTDGLGRCETLCPKCQIQAEAGPVYVNSGWCKSCRYFKGVNTEASTVTCAYNNTYPETKTDMPEEKKSILEEAAEIRKGSRNADYGDAVINFGKIATIASEIAGRDISPRECVAVQMATKLARESYRHKRDNLVDLCGYADIMEEIAEFEDHHGVGADPRLRNM